MAVTPKTSGLFTDTGASEAVTTNGKVLVCLDFASTGSVTLQARPEGVDTWFPVKTYTADVVELAGEEMGDGAGNVEFRLDCTDATGDVGYALGG